MKKLLVINSSARLGRSTTRQLTLRATVNWRVRYPEGTVRCIDVGIVPPPAIDESWIVAAYTRPALRTSGMNATLQASDRFIDEVLDADAIVIGAPMYNFGPPAQLKAFLEQIVRIGRTFDFGPSAENPYLGLVGDKPVLVATSAGSSEMSPGGLTFHLNFNEPQLTAILNLIGLRNITFARLSGQQANPVQLAQSFARAEREVDAWLRAGQERSCLP